jgi:MraZ protein
MGQKLDELSKLNEYDRKSMQFVRYFTGGATNLQPMRRQGAFAKEFIGFCRHYQRGCAYLCMLNKIEVWDKKAHTEMINNEPENFAELAEEVMGNKGRRRDE